MGGIEACLYHLFLISALDGGGMGIGYDFMKWVQHFIDVRCLIQCGKLFTTQRILCLLSNAQ